MNIAGLQKVSTIDYPGEIACTVFLRSCNFRCGFCHNPELVMRACGENFSEDYVLDFLKQRIGKLDGVCITGGEPLVTLDFDFVKKIKNLGYKIKLDTNGSFPEKLKEMIELKLVDYIAMDVKGDKDNYKKIINTNIDLKKIEKSIKIIHDFGNYEFRTTIVNRFHDENSLILMAKWLNNICGEKPKRFFLQGFSKNNTGMIDNDFKNEPNVNEETLKNLKNSIKKFFEKTEIRS